MATRTDERPNPQSGYEPQDPVDGYRLEVQGLRAAAVVVVILYHAAGLLPGGFVGVDVFFVISGFVITRSLVREYERADHISLVSFYRRRVYRLTPALTACLIVTMPLSVLLAPLGAVRTTIATGAAASLLAANIVLAKGPGYFDLGADSNSLAHTWSLSLEEQFYLVFPVVVLALVALGARRNAPRSALKLGLTALGALSLAGCLLAANSGGAVFGIPSTRLAFFAMPLRAWQFIAGALVALYAARLAAIRAQTLLGALGVVLMAASVLLIDEVPYPTAWAIIPTLGAALVLSTPFSVTSQALRWRPLVRAGDVSYSWYLWHWPPMVFARVNGVESRVALVAIGLATYPIAVLSFRHIEQRFTSTGRKPQQRWLKVAFVSVAATLVVAVASFAVFDRATSKSTPVVEAFAAGASGITEECQSVAITDSINACTFGGGSRKLGLVGDSNAAQFTSTVIAAARSIDASVTVVTENGCPVLDVVVVKYGNVDSECRERVTAALPWILDQSYDVVVLAYAFDMYLQAPHERVTSTQPDVADGVDAYADALTRLVRELEVKGTRVVIVHPIPKPGASLRARTDFRTGGGCSLVGVIAGAAGTPLGCRDSFDRADAKELQRIALKAERGAAVGTEALLLDPFEAICSGEECQAYDGMWAYHDYGHVTAAYSDSVLASEFRAALREALRE